MLVLKLNEKLFLDEIKRLANEIASNEFRSDNKPKAQTIVSLCGVVTPDGPLESNSVIQEIVSNESLGKAIFKEKGVDVG